MYNIADDIEAGMQEEEDDAMASPSAGKAKSFIPFTFSPPSSHLFTCPGVRPHVTKTYTTKACGAQSSPSYKASSSTRQQRSSLSHSSPSYGYRQHGLLDAKMHPKLSTLAFAQPAEVEDDLDKAVEAEQQDGGKESRWGGVVPAPAPLRTTPPQTPPRSPKLTKHQELHALLADRLATNQENRAKENCATRTAAAAAPLSTVGLQKSPLPPSSPLSSIPSSPSSPSPSLPPASSSPTAVGRVFAAQDHWCSLLINMYNFAISDSQVWGGGEAWINLVTMVMEFLDPLMENSQHPETVNHPEHTMVRPQEVLGWQKHGRPLEDVNIASLPTYTAMWWAWWSLMQPHARIVPGTSTLAESTYLMDWMPLRQPGDNGLMIVLMTLRWWGVQSHASQGWRDAVADVTSAIFCMTDDVIEDSMVGKKDIHPNAFKALLVPFGKHAYNTAPAQQKRPSQIQAAASKPISSSSHHRQRLTQGAVSKPISSSSHHRQRLTQDTCSALPVPNTSAKKRPAAANQHKSSRPTAPKSGGTTNQKHSWYWAATTSPAPAGAEEVDENEMTGDLPRETRSFKRKRIGAT